jgi:phosphatidylethanolamine-binding protein (PEBP) family uncharacterized protein
MKRSTLTKTTLLALTMGAGLLGCASDEPQQGGGAGSGGSTAGRGGSSGAGGTGGSAGSGGSAGTGGSAGSGGSSGSGGGRAPDARTPDGRTPDGRRPDAARGNDAASTGDAPRADAAPAGGAFAITVDNAGMNGDRLCFKSEASSSGGNRSPLITWTGVPQGTKSFVLSMEDQSGNPTPHQIVTNLPATQTMNPANVGGMLPANSSACYGHANKTAWYGPGAPDVHRYEITVWALAVDRLPQACMGAGNGSTAKAVLGLLKSKRNDPTLVLASNSKVLWGNRDGNCR